MTDKDIKQNLRDQLRKLRSNTLVLMVVTFSVIGVLIGYYISGDLFTGPFKNVSIDTLGESVIRVSFETSTPSITKIKYGTSDIYMNELTISESFSNNHQIDLRNLLPQRSHMIKLYAKEADGQEHLSPSYEVK